MMDLALPLTSEQLQFDRSGRYTIFIAADRTCMVRDTAAAHEVQRDVRMPMHGVRAVAGFDDQIWTANQTTLERYDFEGRVIGEPFTLPVADVTWSAAPCGPAGVVLRAQPPHAVVDDLGTLATCELADADVIIPFTARRVVAIFGTRVQMPAGIVNHLPPGSRAVGGIVLADGKWLVIVSVREGRRELVVIALASGQLITRLNVTRGLLRIAARRGIAAIQVEPTRIAAIDLRLGRELGSFTIDEAFDDFAIDPHGGRIAVRRANGLRLLDLATALQDARAHIKSGPSEIVVPAAAATLPSPRLASGSNAAIELEPVGELEAHEPAPSPVVSLIPPGPLIALAPRRSGPALSHARSLELLEAERDVILARCRSGIALGWDSRRLGYANESTHPFELEVAALLGAGRGHATAHVVEAQRALASARAARDANRADDFAASPLGELSQEFELTALDLDALVAIAAPALWGETARLYAVLANDTGRGIVDEMLVEQVLAGSAERYHIAAALSPDARLRRHGLVIATSRHARPFAHLATSPIVAARLTGEPLPVPDGIRFRAATTPLAELIVPQSHVAALLRELSSPMPAPRIVVRGRRGSGRKSLLAAICAHANRGLGVIDLARLPAQELGAALSSHMRSASLSGLVPCLVGIVRDGDVNAVVDAVTAHPGPVTAAFGIDEGIVFPEGPREIVLPNLTSGQRLDHWRAVITHHELAVADPEDLSSRFRLAPGIVERAAAQVARNSEAGREASYDLEAVIRHGRDERLARLATRVTRLPRWSDVVLPPDVLDSLRELVGRVRHARRVYEQWGFDEVMTTGRGLTALFDGRPGTGKTMVAGIIARELGLDLYRVDVSRLVSKWIGETEKNLAEIFDAVDDGQAIILFDEADSLFARRTEVKTSNDRYANLEVNYLLQRIDAFDGIAILTTNFGSAIDPAFRRRVSFRMTFPFPDEEAREQLWRVHLPARLPIEGELDLPALARKFQLAGGYIRNACLRAAFLAAQEETSLAQRHLERAVQLEYQQVGKISTSGPVE